MTDDTTPDERIGVSTLELFFDLVFVFTITQLTGVLADEPTWTGLLQVSLMLAIIFWMYGGYVWLTNSVSVDRLTRRLTLLGGMAGFFLVALAIPAAFSGKRRDLRPRLHGRRTAPPGDVRALDPRLHGAGDRGLAPFNLSTAALVLVGGLIGGTAQYVIWTIAVIGEWASPKLIDDSGFVIEPGHFVERHGLVVLIAIGESVIAVGIGAAGLDGRHSAGRGRAAWPRAQRMPVVDALRQRRGRARAGDGRQPRCAPGPGLRSRRSATGTW